MPIPPDSQPDPLRWLVAFMLPEALQTQAEAVIADLSDRYGTRTAYAPPHHVAIGSAKLRRIALRISPQHDQRHRKGAGPSSRRCGQSCSSENLRGNSSRRG